MIIISQVPNRSHTENDVRICRWNSSRHPILFQFWRADAVIGNFADVSGFLAIGFPLSQIAVAGTVTGDSIYISDGAGGLYDIVGTVTAHDTTNGLFYYFETDIPFNGVPVSGGYMNLMNRQGYYIQVEILGTDPISQVQKVWGTSRVSTNPKGYARFDASGYLNGYVDKVNSFLYTAKNQRDRFVYGSYKLRYTGIWVDGQESITTTDGTVYYFCDNVQQLQKKYGQNLCEYYPFNDAALTEKAKFLSDFLKPTYFVGYPFDLSCIIPAFIGNSVGATAMEDMLLSNGTSDGQQDEALTLFKEESVQRIMLKGDYNSNIKSIDFWLQANDVPEESYFVPTYIDPTYYETTGGSPFTPFIITEKKRIKIATPCEPNPVYLAWRNTMGGWSYWLFSRTQEINIGAKINGTFGVEPDDLEDAMARELSTTTSQIEKMTLGGVVDVEDISGLKYLEGSPRVQMLVSQNPVKWMTVNISPKGIKYSTPQPQVNVEFDILMPEYYTVPN